MAKAILEFDLSDSEDRTEHLRAIKALDLVLTLNEFDNYLRSNIKYNEELTNETHTTYVKVREAFRGIMNDNNISIDELLK